VADALAGSYGADGKPVPVTSVTLAGTTWSLYKGPNGSTTVFSFIADSEVEDFKGDLKKFLHYLVMHQGLPKTQFLTSIGAGKSNYYVVLLIVC
jgi:xyloglucan-specific endo-beta-1,4-glucanase